MTVVYKSSEVMKLLDTMKEMYALPYFFRGIWFVVWELNPNEENKGRDALRENVGCQRILLGIW